MVIKLIKNESITYDNLKTLFLKKGYKWDDRIDAINIIGVRNLFTELNKFNDIIVVAYLTNNEQNNGVDKIIKIYQATTLPGILPLLKPLNPKGTAIMCEGQYVDTYKIDLHKGKYKALCQRLGKVCVYRDNDKDNEFDYGNKESGWFGINIHRANKFYSVQDINWYSAGCQVIRNKSDFDELMNLAEKQEKLYGNKFTYTLITTLDF